jgi:tetratricopeptide (TPR) repeat protein
MKKLATTLSIVVSAFVFAAGCGSPTPQEQLQAAGELFQAGDMEGAIELVKSLKDMELDEQTHGEARMALGTFYVYSNDLEAARKEYREVYERFGVENPNPALAQLAQAAIGSLVGEALQSGEAQRALDLALETSGTLTMVSPFSRELALIAAQSLFELERYDESYGHLEDLLKSDPDPRSAMSLKRQMSTIRAIQGQDDVALRLVLEDAENQDNQEILADALMQASNTVFPQGVELTDEQTEKRDGILNRAYDIYQQLLDEATEDPALQANLLMRQSIPLWMQNKKQESVALLRQVADVEGALPETKATALIGLGECYIDMGEMEKAAEALSQAAERYAGSEFAIRANQGLAYIKAQEAADLALDSAVLPPESQPAASQPDSAPAAD